MACAITDHREIRKYVCVKTTSSANFFSLIFADVIMLTKKRKEKKRYHRRTVNEGFDVYETDVQDYIMYTKCNANGSTKRSDSSPSSARQGLKAKNECYRMNGNNNTTTFSFERPNVEKRKGM